MAVITCSWDTENILRSVAEELDYLRARIAELEEDKEELEKEIKELREKLGECDDD